MHIPEGMKSVMSVLTVLMMTGLVVFGTGCLGDDGDGSGPVNINSIEDLNANKDAFDGKIVGIDPGAGMMGVTETAITEYGLDFELQASSSAAMLTELASAIEDNENIVVTLWSPHWAFSKYNLTYLDDPLGVYGGEEHVETLARLGFDNDMPGACAIMERFNWTQAQIQTVMMDVADGADPADAAQDWVDDNPTIVDGWLCNVTGTGEIDFGFVAWEGEIVATNVMAIVLGMAGYDVDMVNLEAPFLYQGLANGDVDITVSAWLPATQSFYWEQYGDDIDSLGTNLEGCKVGLVVPIFD